MRYLIKCGKMYVIVSELFCWQNCCNYCDIIKSMTKGGKIAGKILAWGKMTNWCESDIQTLNSLLGAWLTN